MVDASQRRKSLQAKIGTGLTVDEFRARAGKSMRLVGLTESIGLIARALGWRLDQIEETIEPVAAAPGLVTMADLPIVSVGRVRTSARSKLAAPP